MLPPMFTIEERPESVWLFFSGTIDQEQLQEAMTSVTMLPGYFGKNDLWCFSGCTAGFSQQSLTSLVDVLQARYPKIPQVKKCAIVTSSGLHTALAEIFRLEASDLPIHVRSFIDTGSAERWLSSPEDDRP